MPKSVFSQIIDRDIAGAIIEETDDIIVVRDINPKAPIHYLIVPKKEIKDIQSFEEEDFHYAEKMFKMAQHLSRTIPGAHDFRLQVNSGASVGQHVFHVHMHFLAGGLANG